MSTTPHPIAPEEIMAHLDGELSADRAHAVSAHLENCADCRILSQEFQHTRYNFAMWQVASLPGAIEAHVESVAARAFASSATSSPKNFQRLRFWSRKHWIGALAAVASAIFILSVFSLSKLKPGSPSVDFASAHSTREPQAPATEAKSISSTLSLQESPGLAAPPDRFQRTAGKHPNTADPSLSFGSLEVFAKIQRPTQPQQTGPMIARTVALSVVTKDFDAARASLDSILARHSGYAANLTADTPQGAARSLQASLRVPTPQLPAVLGELKSLGRVETESQNGEEVTQQHADLVARLKNSRETEQRLQAILTQRTGKISDVLEVEQEIARVRGEIEQMEAEQRNLEHRVDFATIELRLSEEYKAKLDSPAPAISTLIHNAAVSGYHNVADTLLALILLFAEYGPVLAFWFLLLLPPGWFVWRRWRHASAAI